MNTLTGRLCKVMESDGIQLLEVAVGACRCTAMTFTAAAAPGWQIGQTVRLTFRELEVSLACQLAGQLSIRNSLPCLVQSVELGRLMARVELQFENHPLQAVITRASAEAMALAPGMPVQALIKSNAMMLQSLPS